MKSYTWTDQHFLSLFWSNVPLLEEKDRFLSFLLINLSSPKVNNLKFMQKISYYKRHVMLDFVLYHLFMFVVMSLHLLENIKPF